MSEVLFELLSLADTEALGRHLGTLLFPGAVVALIGPLGAGKTHLVRAIAQGLDIGNPSQVSSPTFVLIQEYEARLPIYHFDAYRLKSAAEFIDLGVHEYFEGQGVSLVEWPDRVMDAIPAKHLQIAFQITGAESRRLKVSAAGKQYVTLLEDLCRDFNERKFSASCPPGS